MFSQCKAKFFFINKSHFDSFEPQGARKITHTKAVQLNHVGFDNTLFQSTGELSFCPGRKLRTVWQIEKLLKVSPHVVHRSIYTCQDCWCYSWKLWKCLTHDILSEQCILIPIFMASLGIYITPRSPLQPLSALIVKLQ